MTPNGRAVLVTGSARGIGLETSRMLAAAGWQVVGLDVLGPEDDSCFESFYRADLSNVRETESVVKEILQRSAPVYGLVNNAAVAPVGSFLDSSVGTLDDALAINVRSMFVVTRLAAQRMVAAGGGSIVNLASVNAARGVTRTVTYSVTKGAVVAFTRAVAVELASEGVRCNAVAPAPTSTRRVLEVLSDEDIAARTARIPMGRLGRPADMAAAVKFLLSDDASFITGTVLPVDGGYLAYGS